MAIREKTGASAVIFLAAVDRQNANNGRTNEWKSLFTSDAYLGGTSKWSEEEEEEDSRGMQSFADKKSLNALSVPPSCFSGELPRQ